MDGLAALVRWLCRRVRSAHRLLPVLLSLVLGVSLLVLAGPTSAARSGWQGADRCKNIPGVQRRVPRGYERRRHACYRKRRATPATSPVTPSKAPNPAPPPAQPTTGAPTTGTSTTGTSTTGAPTTGAPTTGAPTTGAPTTGTTAPAPGGGVPGPQSGFVRVLADEFNGSTVDTSRWSIYSGGLSSSSGCNEADNLLVTGGVLTMLFAYQSSGGCGANWYHGGMMVRREYGGNNQSVTVRFRVLHNDPVNSRAHRVIPMRWPSASVSGGPAPAWYDGESDYCEGSSVTACTSFLHHTSSSQQVSSPSHQFDMTQWHTFRATQRAGNDVEIFIDDMSTPRWTYDGTTATVPDVFRRTVLQQECRSSCPSDTTDWERVEIDFVTIDNQQ